MPALKDFVVQQGQLYTNLSANYDGASGRVELLQPLSVSIRNLSLAKVGQGGQPSVQLFQKENFAVNVAGKVAMPKDGNITADLSQLTVNQPADTSALIKISNTKPISVVLNPKGGITGNGTLQIVSDIKRLTDSCRQTYFAYEPILAQYKDRPQDVKYLMKHFPLDPKCNSSVTQMVHPAACDAAAG